MAKFDPDAFTKVEISSKQRIAERGVLQFRADSETILAVIDAADKLNIPVSALLRLWVQERLLVDTETLNLTDRVSKLEKLVAELQRQAPINRKMKVQTCDSVPKQF